jgi:N,N'-diacetyllegionaminate synthase
VTERPRHDAGWIRSGGPLVVIAEMGVNHNGDPELALRQLRAAAATGADAVKLQTFRADELATAWAPVAEYQRAAAATSHREMLRRLELGRDALRALFAEGRRLGVVCFSTPFDPGSARMLAELGSPWMKVPSGELTDPDLVAAVAETGLPTIVSTGMSTLEEVRAAVDLFRERRGGPLALLHCVSSYPAPLEQSNLRAMDTLRDAFGVPVGLSDHTLGRDAAVAAVALGADVIEKHFTVDPSLPGPDQSMSMDPAAFAEMVGVLRRVREALGDGVKRPVPAEADTRAVARRSIVAAGAIRAGTVLRREHLALKRPGTGLAPALLGQALGRRLRRDLAPDEPLALDDLEPLP